MSSTFAEIVKAQRVDRKSPGRRRFDAKNIYTLAHRARTGQLTVAKRQRSLWFRTQVFLYRLITRLTGRRV